MIEPKIDDLLAAVDSKYTLVVLSAKRAREINSYYSQLGEGRGEFVPPLVGIEPPAIGRLSRRALDTRREAPAEPAPTVVSPLNHRFREQGGARRRQVSVSHASIARWPGDARREDRGRAPTRDARAGTPVAVATHPRAVRARQPAR